MTHSISLGFSPCPNDTFIFDALIHGKIDTQGLKFCPVISDVEELNKKAFQGSLDVTKLSFHAFIYLTKKYILLNSGSALGNNCGPLLIAKKKYDIKELPSLKIAIPGEYTTANFLLKLAFPNLTSKIPMLFSDIVEAILRGYVDCGVIIHENRFTYEDKGLVKLADLEKYWEKESGSTLLPLGGIAIKREIPLEVKQKIDLILNESIRYAFNNPESSKAFIQSNAQEMSEEVVQKHIKLYVNEYSLNLGEKGRDAIKKLFVSAEKVGLIESVNDEIFIADTKKAELPQNLSSNPAFL